MCGITGIYAFNLVGKFNLVNITAATQALNKRGPTTRIFIMMNLLALVIAGSASLIPVLLPISRCGMKANATA